MKIIPLFRFQLANTLLNLYLAKYTISESRIYLFVEDIKFIQWIIVYKHGYIK